MSAIRCDRYTGKPVDYPSDLLPALNGEKCDHCGSECIDRCVICGAPQCCPVCCRESILQQEARPPSQPLAPDGGEWKKGNL